MQASANPRSVSDSDRVDRFINAVLAVIANSHDEIEELRRTFSCELEEFRQNLEALS